MRTPRADEVERAGLLGEQAGLKARHQALMAALEDMDTWLEQGEFCACMPLCPAPLELHAQTSIAVEQVA
jgi:ribosome modulation factor